MSKYPRTYHLPWSKGSTSDDKMLKDCSDFLNKEIIISEKMDGSNVCLEHENLFARSHSKLPNHPSFNALKAIHASLKDKINPNHQIFGEWLFAKHSILYSDLPSYLMVFGIRDIEKDIFISFDSLVKICNQLNLNMVPIVFNGVIKTEKELKQKTFISQKSIYGDLEGYVIRCKHEFSSFDFSANVAKNVRANHVDPNNDHWIHNEIIKNKLKI